jgi:hypothetical protein
LAGAAGAAGAMVVMGALVPPATGADFGGDFGGFEI